MQHGARAWRAEPCSPGGVADLPPLAVVVVLGVSLSKQGPKEGPLLGRGKVGWCPGGTQRPVGILGEGCGSERCQGNPWVGWAVGALVPEFLQEVAEEGMQFRLADITGPFAEEEAAPD